MNRFEKESSRENQCHPYFGGDFAVVGHHLVDVYESRDHYSGAAGERARALGSTGTDSAAV